MQTALALGVAGAALAIPASAHAATCVLTASVTATPEVTAAGLDWTTTATGCVDTPAVEIEVRDQAAPSDDTGLQLTGLDPAGTQSVPGLVGGHTYDVTLSITADGEGAEDATTVVPLAGPVVVRAEKVSIDSSDHHIVYGKDTTIKGIAKDMSGTVAPDRIVAIQAKPAGNDSWHKVGEDTTSDQGKYSLKVTPNRSTKYRVRVDSATSAAQDVTVDRAVKAHFKDDTVRQGHDAKLVAAVDPSNGGVEVKLQKKKNGNWKTIDKDTTKGGEANFSITAHDDAKFRVTTPTSASYGAGSDIVSLSVR